MNPDFMVGGNGVDQVSSFRPDRPTLGFFQGLRQQMANGAARAVLIVDYVGLNGAFAVSSSPTIREHGGQPFFMLWRDRDRGISNRSGPAAPQIRSNKNTIR